MIDALLAWRPQTWVDYLLLYIVPGFGMAMYLLAKTIRERPSEFARGLLNVLGKKLTLVAVSYTHLTLPTKRIV